MGVNIAPSSVWYEEGKERHLVLVLWEISVCFSLHRWKWEALACVPGTLGSGYEID